MPEEINQEIEALQELVSVLERSQEGLEKAGLSAESLTEFIESLNAAIAGTISVLPQLEQILSVINKIESGEGGRERLAGIGQKRLDLATKGQGLYKEQQEVPDIDTTEPIKKLKELDEVLDEIKSATTEIELEIEVSDEPIENLKTIQQEIEKLDDEELTRITEKFKELSDVQISTKNLKEIQQVLKELESGKIKFEDLHLTTDQIKQLLEALIQIKTLDFSGSEKIFKRFATEAARMVKSSNEAATQISYLREKLKGFGVDKAEIDKVASSLEQLGKFRVRDVFTELEKLDLPEEELRKFTNEFIVLSRNSTEIEKFSEALKSLKLPQDAIDTLVKTFTVLGVAVQDIDAKMGTASKTTQPLRVAWTTAAGAGDNFTVTLDKVSRAIVDVSQAASQSKSPLYEFVEGLKDIGVPRVERRKIVEETFGEGATDTSKIRVTPLDDGVKKLNTTLQIGSKATQAYSVTINELGEVIEEAGQKAAKSPLRQFAEGLKAAGAPRQVRRQIIEETSGQGIEGITGTRITELDDDITRLNTTLKLGGEITKAYVIHWDEFGNTMDRLEVKDTTVSISDFTDQLSGRVGAIENVNKAVEKYGFSISDLKKMSTEASTGITRLDFSMKSMGGATEKLTLHVTEFGKVLTDTQRRFRTFAGGIVRNIGHSFQWAIAITAIYGPLRKLQDLVQLSIDNESKLADIGVVLGKNTSELQSIFEDAAQAAQATGESLNGVIEGYALAYRATGNIANQSERAEVAQQLLIDSLVLSKLSSLEQAEAMDTLVAGLLQVGYSLDQGGELLNKWVAVSKAANVSVDTLASSFAIMATAAQGVGLEFDELNAIVAVVAANTELSATQAGNAVRAFVSGFQTNNAREELAKFGIAVEDLNGDARDFMKVMYDIKALMDAGLIDDAELNRIGTALGGRGARRGAQFTTFLKSLDEVQGLVTVSAEAQADAYDALGVKMNTVQTAITNLATSFQVLSNAVGTDGGILDLLKTLLGYLNDITEAATSFVSVMGKAAPLLVAGGGLLAYGSSIGRVQQLPGQFGGAVSGLLGRTGYGQRQDPKAFTIDAGGTGRTMAQAWGNTAKIYAPVIGTLAAQGMMAYINYKDEDWDGLGAQIGGGVVGFMIGGPLGSIIGSTIAESVINGLAAAGTSGELADAFKGAFARPEDEEEEEDDDLTREERLLEKSAKLNEELQRTMGSEWLTGVSLWAKTNQDFLRDLVGISKVWADDLDATILAGEAVEQTIAAYDKGGVDEARVKGREYDLSGFLFGTDEQIVAIIERFKELRDEIEKTNADLASIGEGKEPEGTALDTELTRNMETYGDLLVNEIIKAQDEFNKQLIDGDITIKQYRESMERMGSEGEAIMQVYSVLNDVLGDSAENLILVLDVMSKTSAEENNIITNLTSGIGDLKQQIDEAEAAGDRDLVTINTEKLEAALFEIEAIFNQLRTVQREPLILFDEPIGLDTRSLEDHRRVVTEAMRLLEEDMQENIRLGLIPSDTTIQEVLATHEEIAVAIAGIYVETMQIPMDYYKQAQENLAIPGRIAPPVSADRGISVKTIEQSQGAFMAAYEKQLQFLKSAFGDLYQGDFSTVGIIFSDGVDVLHLDNLAMQLAMDDLIDVNQKQLEGVYNLPTDASFYVPFQGYKLGFGEDGAGGGLSGAADELKEAADHLKSLEPGEDWGESIDDVMKEWFGAERVDRPQPSEAFGTPDDPIGPWRYGGEKRFTTEPKDDLIGPWRYNDQITEPPIGPWLQEEDTLLDKLNSWADDLHNKLIDLFKLPEQTLASPLDLDRFTPTVAGRRTLPTEGLPGSGTAGAVVEETQSLSTILIENLFNFNSAIETLKQIFQNLFPDTTGIPGTGIGAGIGPQLDFTKLDSAANSLENVVTVLQPQLQPYVQAGPFGTSDVTTEFSGVLDALNQKISNLSGFTTNLKLSSTYTANLIVDGRTLAQIIKPYLYTDMIRFEDSAASITKTIVV